MRAHVSFDHNVEISSKQCELSGFHAAKDAWLAASKRHLKTERRQQRAGRSGVTRTRDGIGKL